MAEGATNSVTNVLTNSLADSPTNSVAKAFAAVPDWLNPEKSLQGALILGVIFIFVAWLAGRILSLAVCRILERPKEGHLRRHIVADKTAVRFLGQLVKVGLYLFVFITYTRFVPALSGLGTAWLASVGVVSVVVGMAARDTLGNLIAGIAVLLYRPFNIGDRVQVMAPTGLEFGVVESLNLGYTVLRTPDNRRIVVPNSLMASQTNVNHSESGERFLCMVPVVIAPDADVEKARSILIELAKEYSKKEEPAGCPVTALAASGVTLTLKVWCADYLDATDVKSTLLDGARKRFKAEGIELR